jgi:uncharacterized membrane protein
MNSAELRKTKKRILVELRWIKAAIIALIIILSPLLYYDLYASKPPSISTPILLKPDTDDQIKIKIDEVEDGKLHRFSFVSDDNQVIRFFLMNRYQEQTKITSCFDACTMCGDQGYIQDKEYVVCLACNVRIFVPSLGKSGGCNPIPLKHRAQAILS